MSTELLGRISPFVTAAGSLFSGVAGLSSGISALSGGGSLGRIPLTSVPTNIRTPSLGINFNNPTAVFTRSTQPSVIEDELRTRLGGIGTSLGGLRTELGELRGKVEPGFGGLTEANVKAVRNARDAAIGNLRDAFNRRRVAGSSFAADALTRAELTFAEEEKKVRAQAFVDELSLSLGINQQDAQLLTQQMNAITQEADILKQGVDREFKELQITSDVAFNIATLIERIAEFNMSLAATEAQLRAGDIAGIGGALGDIGAGLGGLGSALGAGDAAVAGSAQPIDAGGGGAPGPGAGSDLLLNTGNAANLFPIGTTLGQFGTVGAAVTPAVASALGVPLGTTLTPNMALALTGPAAPAGSGLGATMGLAQSLGGTTAGGTSTLAGGIGADTLSAASINAAGGATAAQSAAVFGTPLAGIVGAGVAFAGLMALKAWGDKKQAARELKNMKQMRDILLSGEALPSYDDLVKNTFQWRVIEPGTALDQGGGSPGQPFEHLFDDHVLSMLENIKGGFFTGTTPEMIARADEYIEKLKTERVEWTDNQISGIKNLHPEIEQALAKESHETRLKWLIAYRKAPLTIRHTFTERPVGPLANEEIQRFIRRFRDG